MRMSPILSFNSIYNEHILLNYYKICKHVYIDLETLDIIINKIKSVIISINNEMEKSNNNLIYSYLKSMKDIVEIDLDINNKLRNTLVNFTYLEKSSNIKIIENVKFVLTEKLEIIPVIHHNYSVFGVDYGFLYYYSLKDYNGCKEELINKMNEDIKNNKEDKEYLLFKESMRRLILEYNHPEEFVDENGDYDYNKISLNGIHRFGDVEFEIKTLARSYSFRRRSENHFK